MNFTKCNADNIAKTTILNVDLITEQNNNSGLVLRFVKAVAGKYRTYLYK